MFMKCPHCFREVTTTWSQDHVRSAEQDLYLMRFLCPFCAKAAIAIEVVESGRPPGGQPIVVHPLGNPRPVAREVPTHFAADFREASMLLGVSPKASAALSRRCLQRLLIEAGGATKRDLAQQIEEVVNLGMMPSIIKDQVHALRHFGNFGAHPIADQQTGCIVDVEPGEAEWCLETLEALFDLWYVEQARAAQRKADLNAKLIAHGKPPFP